MTRADELFLATISPRESLEKADFLSRGNS